MGYNDPVPELYPSGRNCIRILRQARCRNSQSSITVSVTEKNGIAHTGKAQPTPTHCWQQYILTLPGIKAGDSNLVMLFECQDVVDPDVINLRSRIPSGGSIPYLSLHGKGCSIQVASHFRVHRLILQ